MVDHQVQIVKGRTKCIESWELEYCPLYICEACLLRSGGHRLQYRPNQKILCMSCWNQLRQIERQQQEIDQISGLIRKLERARYAH